MLRLVIGPSGAGKTPYITERIRADVEAGRRCFLLIPEQQAYISERDLPEKLPPNAGLFLEIVNFSSLAEDVFREYGGVTQASMSGGMKMLLMWDTLRTAAPQLLQYRKNVTSDTTLPSMMLAAVENLRSSGITGTDLEKIADAIGEDCVLQRKLCDLATVDAIFHAKCETAFGNDPADKLSRMAKLLRTHKFFSECRLYVDSFSSFTAPEYEVLLEILRQADEVTVSLCTDGLYSKMPHFAGSANTARELVELAKKAGVPIEREILRPKEDQKPQALTLLERDLWRFDVKESPAKDFSNEEKSCIKLLRASNLYEESEAAALNILDLVQNGMHYGDIAVFVRDAEVYRGVLDSAMERHGIPYFFSERTDLSAKPLSRLILSALRAVSRHYRAQDVMTLLKTGLLNVTPEEAAMFEEYCNTWHISGSRFCDPVWSMNPDGLTDRTSPRTNRILEVANRVRKTVIEPLERLSAALRASTLLTERCRALYDYLSELSVAERLSERAKHELASGARREAGETVRLYHFTVETLSTLCRLMPEATVTTDEFILALTLLFSETDLGSVPNLHDCVMIGSAATMRVENVKASLLLGLCEGEFPCSVSDEGILSQTDLSQMEQLISKLEKKTEFRSAMKLRSKLDQSPALRSAEELFYVYRAMTKPSERLILSTVAKQTDGSARTPSLAFSRVAFLLDQTPEEFDSEEIRCLLDNPLPSALQGKHHVLPATEPITLHLSQSSIKSFVLCPYQYYLTHTLGLREQKDSRPSYADDGTFLHYVLEHFLRRARTEDGKLKIPSDDEIPAISHSIVDEYIKKVCPVPPQMMDRHLLHLFMRLERLALTMLRDILAELRAGLFVPTKFEQRIGAHKELPPVEFELSGGSRVTLSGTIDRVDLYEENGKCYVRVIDYKSGTHKFKLEDVKTGKDIQLILYLFAFCSSDPDRYLAGGAQFLYAKAKNGSVTVQRSGFHADNEVVRRISDTTEKQVFAKKTIWKTADEIRELTDDMKTAVTAVAERILAGEADKTPSEDACKFCVARTYCDLACRKKSF